MPGTFRDVAPTWLPSAPTLGAPVGPAGTAAGPVPLKVAAMTTMTKPHTTTTTSGTPELPPETLEGSRARAGEPDRTNSYFPEDMAELHAAGHLAAVRPAEPRGWGPAPAVTTARAP